MIGYHEKEMNKVFFTADHHFGHSNIIEYAHRPFSDAEAMDAALVENWNRVVPKDGHVFHLGDFTLGDEAHKYIHQLNGIIYMLRIDWHHDRRWLPRNNVIIPTKTGWLHFLEPEEIIEINVEKEHYQVIHLSHYPLAVWDRKHYGAWHLHGHSHGNYTAPGCILDVGVDGELSGYEPIPYSVVRDYMTVRLALQL